MIIGYEHVPASIDVFAQFGGRPEREVEATFPPIGAPERPHRTTPQVRISIVVSSTTVGVMP